MQVRSLGQEDPLEQEMAIHSSIPHGKIPWTEDLLCYVHVAAKSRARLGEKADTHPMATKYTKKTLTITH